MSACRSPADVARAPVALCTTSETSVHVPSNCFLTASIVFGPEATALVLYGPLEVPPSQAEIAARINPIAIVLVQRCIMFILQGALLDDRNRRR